MSFVVPGRRSCAGGALKSLNNSVLDLRMNFGRISDDCLVARLKTFIGCKRRLVAKVVMYLVEVERRRIHLEDRAGPGAGAVARVGERRT